jgi:hypothetical protein
VRPALFHRLPPLRYLKLLEESLELSWRLEPVASGVSADVGVRDEDYQRVIAEFEHS